MKAICYSLQKAIEHAGACKQNNYFCVIFVLQQFVDVWLVTNVDMATAYTW